MLLIEARSEYTPFFFTIIQSICPSSHYNEYETKQYKRIKECY